MAHFVARAVAGFDLLRRGIRVAWVRGRVVVGDAHVDCRSLGKMHRLAVGEDTLPIEIPVWNIDEFAAGLIGESCPGFDVFAEIVRVRVNAEQVDWDGES